MLLKVDAAQLEWRVKIFLAQDKVGIKEILENFDLHTDNQKTFELPSRVIAKNFVYRMIFADAFGKNGFRGPAYAYANDADFAATSDSVKFWENVVEKFFGKYEGIYQHSIGLIRQASSSGKISTPSGRIYTFTPVQSRFVEGPDWPRTQILNFPVQGFAADLMIIARLLLYHRLPGLGYGPKALLINTVHDDIELDVDNDPELVYNICILLEQVFADIPKEFEKRFGEKISVPMAGEVKMGWTLFEGDMVKFKPKTFEEDWRKLYAN